MQQHNQLPMGYGQQLQSQQFQFQQPTQNYGENQSTNLQLQSQQQQLQMQLQQYNSAGMGFSQLSQQQQQPMQAMPQQPDTLSQFQRQSSPFQDSFSASQETHQQLAALARGVNSDFYMMQQQQPPQHLAPHQQQHLSTDQFGTGGVGAGLYDSNNDAFGSMAQLMNSGGGMGTQNFYHNPNQLASLPQPSTTPSRRREPKKRRAKTFPEKLMKALSEFTNEDAVAWLPDGKSFVIVQPDEFVNNVLNGVFKAAKYASFVRKLHRWGFVRLTSGTGTDCFHHPLFIRNQPELASRISCTSPGRASTGRSPLDPQPPSLAGVERFIRAKAAAAAASARETTEQPELQIQKRAAALVQGMRQEDLIALQASALVQKPVELPASSAPSQQQSQRKTATTKDETDPTTAPLDSQPPSSCTGPGASFTTTQSNDDTSDAAIEYCILGDMRSDNGLKKDEEQEEPLDDPQPHVATSHHPAPIHSSVALHHHDEV